MKFIKVTHSLNKSYNVEDLALKQAVKKTFNELKGLKLIDSEVIINEANTGFKVKIKISKRATTSFVDATKNVEEKLNEYSLNLIGSKPDNIQITFGEEK